MWAGLSGRIQPSLQPPAHCRRDLAGFIRTPQRFGGCEFRKVFSTGPQNRTDVTLTWPASHCRACDAPVRWQKQAALATERVARVQQVEKMGLLSDKIASAILQAIPNSAGQAAGLCVTRALQGKVATAVHAAGVAAQPLVGATP